MSLAAKGKPKSDVWKKSHSNKMKGRVNKWQLGRKVSLETKLKMSLAGKGRKQAPEHIAKRIAKRVQTLSTRQCNDTAKKINLLIEN